MASTKFPPAMPPVRTGATAVKTPAMKTAPALTKAAVAPVALRSASRAELRQGGPPCV